MGFNLSENQGVKVNNLFKIILMFKRYCFLFSSYLVLNLLRQKWLRVPIKLFTVSVLTWAIQSQPEFIASYIINNKIARIYAL